MKFPPYVPGPVQIYITTLIDGGGGVRGWAAALKGGHSDSDWLVEIVAFLRKFTTYNGDLCLAFDELNKAELTAEQLKQFINAAWASLTDYQKYRDKLKAAEQLRQDIAVTATNLAQQLREISNSGLPSFVPMEFYDIRTLLRETDNPNDILWTTMRRHVLGDNNEDTNYAWGLSPSLPELLDTVAKTAHNYEPSAFGRIGAAVGGSRQHSPRTEYIRAFLHMLREAGISPSYPVQKAMAAVASVALEKHNVQVSDADIRQQLPSE